MLRRWSRSKASAATNRAVRFPLKTRPAHFDRSRRVEHTHREFLRDFVHQMVEILEEGLLQPFGFRQGHGHVHTDLRGRCCRRLTGMPMSAASQPMRITSDTWPWTFRISVPCASKRENACPADLRYSPELICVQGAACRSVRRHFVIVAAGSGLRPKQLVARRGEDRLKLHQRFASTTSTSLASIIISAPSGTRLFQQRQAVQGRARNRHGRP